MAKKKAETPLDKFNYLNRLPIYCYLWEFIRRNKEYQKLFESFQKRLKRMEQLELNVYEQMHDKQLKKILKVCSHFKIKFPLDPSKKSNEFYRSTLKDNLIYRKGVRFITSFNHIDRFVLAQEALKESGPNKQDLLIAINTLVPIHRILAGVKSIVKEYHTNPGERITQRRRIREEWKDFIIAYDLKKGGLSIEEIAKLLFPEENNGYPDYRGNKKVSRYIKEADRLIRCGYKDFLP
jgi:hypothetical protein